MSKTGEYDGMSEAELRRKAALQKEIIESEQKSLSAYRARLEQREQEIVAGSGFAIKDSGKREEFAGGMVRDTAEGKINFALVADGPMLRRWAQHLTNGAKKYAKRNWMLAEGQEEYDRARESAFRHFMQWYYGERDEDHGSAVFFNINEAEYIREKGLVVQNK